MKKVRKLLPDNIIFTGKIESWLSDMAKEGLHLKKLKNFYAVFEKGEPADVEYRIIAFEQVPTKEKLEEFSNNNWEKVPYRKNGYLLRFLLNPGENEEFYIFRNNDANFIEINGNIIEDDYLYDATLKHREAVFYYIILLNGFSIYMFISILKNRFLYNGLNLLDMAFLAVLGILLYLLALIIYSIRCTKLKNLLKTDKTINHHQNWKSRAHLNRFKIIILSLLYLTFITSGVRREILMFHYYSHLSLSKTENIVRLSDINDNPETEYDYTNGHVTKTILTPLSYETIEFGDNQTFYYNYDRLLFKSFVPKAFDSWVKDYSNTNDFGEIVYINSLYFNNVAYTKSKNGLFICLYKDNIFMHFRIFGSDKSPEQIITALEDVMTSTN